MVAAGMTPMQAIVAATKTSGRSCSSSIGSARLPRGKSADFVVLDANPLENIGNTKKISKVYQRGQEVNRAALRANWRALKAATLQTCVCSSASVARSLARVTSR